MFLVSLYRAVKFAVQDFWRNIWLSLITVFIVALTLLMVNLLIIINVLANHSIKLVEEKVDISIYFTPKAAENQVLEVRSKLLEMPAVKEVTYISSAEAYENFKAKNQNNLDVSETLKELEANPLGATLVIVAKDPQYYSVIMKSLEDESYNNLIESKDFEDHEAIIKKINDLTSRVYRVGVGLSLFLALIVILIVFNTVRMAIYTHREEIGIMKLVGANNWFVRSPFLLSGILCSLVACILTVIVMYPLLGVIQSYVGGFFGSDSFNLVDYFNGHFLPIFGLEFLAMVLLNVLSTSWATRRYLKV
jgi:cell division transport system permease protein